MRNALDAPRAIQLQDALIDAQQLDGCRAIILAGTEASFCSGGDLNFFLRAAAETPEHIRSIIESVYQPLVTTIIESPVPVLAAVDGPAVGLGMDIAMACDVCFIGEHGTFMQGWARVGLIAGAGGTLLADRAISRHDLWRMIVDQPVIDWREAAELGLAAAAESGSAEQDALRFADRVTRLPRATVAAYKALLRGLSRDLGDHLREAVALQSVLLTSEVFKDRAGRILDRTSPRVQRRSALDEAQS